MKDERQRCFKSCGKIQVVLDVKCVSRQIQELHFHTNLQSNLEGLIEKNWKVFESNFLYCAHETNLTVV